MEAGLEIEELTKILCRLRPGMKLVVPDEWLDRNLPGPRVKQVTRIKQMALDYQCSWQQEMGVQVFEKLRPAYTG